jgi:hypothetical protein
VYACFASSLTVIAAAPIVNTPPAITSLLRLLLFGADLPFGPAAPPSGLVVDLAAVAVLFALVSAALTTGPFTTTRSASIFVANLLSPCILPAKALRCGIACAWEREHARQVHDGTVPLRRSNGEIVYNADIIAW